MSAQVVRSRRFGRPRIISLEQVVQAAYEIGLERLDMATVAKKLGIGIATLYGYVDGRDHLVRLVARRLANAATVEDHGQPWEVALRDHADALYRTYRECPQLLVRQAEGCVGDPSISVTPDALLALLIARGFAPSEAAAAYGQVLQAVSGAALAAACFDRLCDEAGGKDVFLEGLSQRCAANGFDALAACLSVDDLPGAASDYRAPLERMIAEQRARMASRGG